MYNQRGRGGPPGDFRDRRGPDYGPGRGGGFDQRRSFDERRLQAPHGGDWRPAGPPAALLDPPLGQPAVRSGVVAVHKEPVIDREKVRGRGCRRRRLAAASLHSLKATMAAQNLRRHSSSHCPPACPPTCPRLLARLFPRPAGVPAAAAGVPTPRSAPSAGGVCEAGR